MIVLGRSSRAKIIDFEQAAADSVTNPYSEPAEEFPRPFFNDLNSVLPHLSRHLPLRNAETKRTVGRGECKEDLEIFIKYAQKSKELFQENDSDRSGMLDSLLTFRSISKLDRVTGLSRTMEFHNFRIARKFPNLIVAPKNEDFLKGVRPYAVVKLLG